MTGIGPEDRLDEAIKQVEIVQEDVDLPTVHTRELDDVQDALVAIKSDLEEVGGHG